MLRIMLQLRLSYLQSLPVKSITSDAMFGL